jgi:hypothetical protein
MKVKGNRSASLSGERQQEREGFRRARNSEDGDAN